MQEGLEDEWALAFHDINPQAPTHVLVLPKGNYCSFADFSATASDAEIAGFVRAVGKVAKDLGLEAPGYRLLLNMGAHSGQEVPHLHVHLFGGRRWGGCCRYHSRSDAGQPNNRRCEERSDSYFSSSPGSSRARADKPRAPSARPANTP